MTGSCLTKAERVKLVAEMVARWYDNPDSAEYPEVIALAYTILADIEAEDAKRFPRAQSRELPECVVSSVFGPETPCGVPSCPLHGNRPIDLRD